MYALFEDLLYFPQSQVSNRSKGDRDLENCQAKGTYFTIYSLMAEYFVHSTGSSYNLYFLKYIIINLYAKQIEIFWN